MRQRRIPTGCSSLFILLIFVFLFFFTQFLISALDTLGLSPTMAFAATLGIFLGGMINIPVARLEREQPVESRPVYLFGLDRLAERWKKQQRYTVIAVNVGGALVPVAIVVYELIRIVNRGAQATLIAVGAIALNIAICYWLARPVEDRGITLPILVPGAVAALSALLFIPEFAAPVAFSAGVLGPLIGADLLHLGDIKKISSGVASIGGGGTFDGIVISGLLATLLA